MNTDNIRRVDKYGRIVLDARLSRKCGINKNGWVAICKHTNPNSLLIKPLNQLQGCEVLTTVRILKYRRTIPARLRGNIKKIKMFELQGNLILEETR